MFLIRDKKVTRKRIIRSEPAFAFLRHMATHLTYYDHAGFKLTTPSGKFLRWRAK
jgi:hypothetical protein